MLCHFKDHRDSIRYMVSDRIQLVWCQWIGGEVGYYGARLDLSFITNCASSTMTPQNGSFASIRLCIKVARPGDAALHRNLYLYDQNFSKILHIQLRAGQSEREITLVERLIIMRSHHAYRSVYDLTRCYMQAMVLVTYCTDLTSASPITSLKSIKYSTGSCR